MCRLTTLIPMTRNWLCLTNWNPSTKSLQAYALGETTVEGLTVQERTMLRSRYIHLSANWNAAKGFNSSDLDIVFINRPAKNNQRVVHPQ